MNWYIEAWKRYAQFSGRSSREAFWMFFLVNGLLTLLFVALEISLQMTWKIEAIYSLLIFLPMLSLTVRRLHDSNRSAWWLLVVLLPVIGMVVLLVLLAMPSESPINSIDYQPNNLNL
jgi:uncharacterized membrane protein YhaH (DUF805 family)